MKRCYNKSDIPTTPHYAIIGFVSVFTEGDERSRTTGHGYGPSTDYYCHYTAYDDEQEWKNGIEYLTTSKYGKNDNFVAIKVTPAEITTKTVVTVN